MNYILILTLLVSSIICRSQDSNDDWLPDDTIFVEYPDKIFYYNLDSICPKSIHDLKFGHKTRYSIIDTLRKPDGLVINDNKNGDVFVALKKVDRYLLFAVDASEENLTLKRLNLNNKGSDELIIQYSRKTGRGFPSWEENYYGIEILDLDSITILFSYAGLFHIDNPPDPKPKNYSDQLCYFHFSKDGIIINDERDKMLLRKYKFINGKFIRSKLQKKK